MGFGSFLKNVVTFGASGRIEDAIESYKYSLEKFNELHEQVESKRKAVNRNLEKLVQSKKNALLSLRKMKKISRNLGKTRQRDLQNNDVSVDINYTFSTIDKTISTGEIAMSSTKGASVGVSTAMGAWALAGTFGTASTGTAIGSLTGAAATNATLAYLGGGAAAMGGGGMVAGTAVLGGLVALPALILTGVFSHVSANKKIKEIEEKEYEIIQATEDCEKALLSFDLISKRSIEITTALDKARSAFEIELNKIYLSIYPRFYSKFIKSIRKIFTGKYFSADDLNNISYIGKVAYSLTQLIDQPLFDEDGNPV